MNTKEEASTFVTISEASKLTGLSRCYIRELCKKGKAPCVRIGTARNATYKINYRRFVELLDSMAEGMA